MRGVVLLFLLSLWPGGQVDAINQDVLANVVQEMRKFGLPGRQYAMAVILTQQQCNQNQVKFDLNPLNVQNKLNDNNIYTGDWLIAATPLITDLYTDHAEYRLLSGGNSSPMQTLINKAGHNDGQCIVFFSTYSPCLEKCNNPNGRYDIVPLMKVFQDFDKKRKAFVFYKIWEPKRKSTKDNPVYNPSRQWMFDSFKRIDGHLPVYRCDRFKENNKWVNRCYRCVTNPDPLTNKCLEGYQ